ncbi:zinc finger protein 2-like isoform X2 [Ambystoma mexicanum]|uniref:zinc finger protein 2-like isoform X2 n=1 Tax=Ambystoma mexicanum TaxID=8296 RepID=UPI0037E8B29A
MTTAKEMPQRKSDEAPLTFCDVAACFSEEEWTLLQLWQKELYTNVMKEIHQAFTSLGPLIATSVFSLRPKEKEELCFKDHHALEGTSNISSSSWHAGMTPVSFNIKIEGKPYFIDQLDFDGEKCITTSKGEAEIMPLSLNIKTEGQPYSMDHHKLEGNECLTTTTTGNGIMNRGIVSNSLKSDDNSRFRKSPSKILEASAVQSFYKKNKILNEGSGSHRKLEWQSTCRQLAHSSFHQLTPSVQRSHTYTDCESTQLVGIIQSDSAPLQSCRKYVCSESEKISPTIGHTGHQRAQEAKGRYTSIDSGNSFSSMTAFTRHERTHPGERPYHCTVQEKGLNQSKALYLHQKTPTGESGQTFQVDNHREEKQAHKVKGRNTCTACGKSLCSVSALVRHERTHTGERPYQCTVCGKTFNQTGALYRHQKIHTRERQASM